MLLFGCARAEAPDPRWFSGLYTFAIAHDLRVEKLPGTDSYKLANDRVELVIVAGSNQITANGQPRMLARSPMVYQGSVYVPTELENHIVFAPPSPAIPSPGSTRGGARRKKPELVVIDPGHGGKDAGACGRFLKEKEINLAIALELGRYLTARGVRVAYTREDDRFIPLDERAMIANKAGADLFVCIHTNATRSGTARGFELYYVDDKYSSSERAKWLRGLSIPARYGCRGRQDELIRTIVYSILLEEGKVASRELVESVKRSMDAVTASPNRGGRPGPWRVMRLVHMPHVFVEVGFVSNPEEERQLSSLSYRRSLGEAIGKGILDLYP